MTSNCTSWQGSTHRDLPDEALEEEAVLSGWWIVPGSLLGAYVWYAIGRACLAWLSG